MLRLVIERFGLLNAVYLEGYIRSVNVNRDGRTSEEATEVTESAMSVEKVWGLRIGEEWEGLTFREVEAKAKMGEERWLNPVQRKGTEGIDFGLDVKR